MIEVFKIVHNVYDNRAAPLLSYYDSMLLEVTSLSYKIIVLIIILEKFFFSARIVNIPYGTVYQIV